MSTPRTHAGGLARRRHHSRYDRHDGPGHRGPRALYETATRMCRAHETTLAGTATKSSADLIITPIGRYLGECGRDHTTSSTWLASR